ncbi:hypothetical protein N7462_001444 [Penicillium macrosclerotiorum]|uniref:uncharacterized protein n=1 Tax=Penicillium macrosclerotiorum TaxID=303699 RepID=UPI00254787FA|nr:uncharacterized protein N7462_001444 [Penicillium macrosclerotiorum]KAJ5692021.1 hypothetical protein N7462_001444 [Penicillium macrosclerotiorum]
MKKIMVTVLQLEHGLIDVSRVDNWCRFGPGTRSDKWGSREEASARALQESTVTAGNERLLRSHHRSLAPCPFVYQVTEADEKKIWVVSVGPNVPIYDTHAGGREIHIHPEYLLPQLSQVYSGSRKDPLHRRINPRRFLPPSDLELLRRFFPSAVGARVLISGFIIVLFDNRKDIEASWLEGCVPSFGLLRLGYDVAVHYPTETVMDSGNAVSSSPDETESATPLGLKLKFPNGSQGIAVPTHAFVDVKTPQENISQKHESWLSKTKATFSKAAVMRVRERIKMGTPVDSALGKSVWFVQEPKEKIGNVTTTYDHHIARMSTFPQTIDHDTSIVTGDHLPKVLNPPRAPRIIGWGDYRHTLDGHLVFAMALNALSENSKAKNRRDPFGTIQKAIVEGTEYLWNRKTRTQSAAILWRAMHDGTEMEGLSGSVLCLGESTDPNCRAVLLKHFETPICPPHFHETENATAHGDFSWSSISGGFVLPPEIRDAQIICETDESSAIPLDEQTWDIE